MVGLPSLLEGELTMRSHEWRGWKVNFAHYLSQNSCYRDIVVKAWHPGEKGLVFIFKSTMSDSYCVNAKYDKSGWFYTLRVMEERIHKAIDLWEDEPKVRDWFAIAGFEGLNEMLVREL